MSGRAVRLARQVWQALRTISGDDAYERYLRHFAAVHAGADASAEGAQVPMSRAVFYRAELERRWSGVNRCC